VALPPEQQQDAPRFGMHPALLDAALHAASIATTDEDVADSAEADQVRLPFAWNGVHLYATGATALRLRLAPSGPDAVRLQLADDTGTPVASVDSLVFRTMAADRLDAVRPGPDSLFRIDWAPVTLPVHDGPPLADDLVVDTTGWVGGDGPDRARVLTSGVLARLQEWDATARASSRLVIVTRGAVQPRDGDTRPPRPCGALSVPRRRSSPTASSWWTSTICPQGTF
jgi:Polyketide synthase dehydratase